MLLLFLCFITCLSNDSCHLQTLFNEKYYNGNYKNVLSYSAGALISSARSNNFNGGAIGSLLKDQFYLTNVGLKDTWCNLPCYVKIKLLQPQFLNKIIFRMNDQLGRTYDLKVYIGYQTIETLIYANTSLVGPIKIKFNSTLVSYIKFLNNNGNNQDSGMSIVKVIATYTF